MCKWKPSYLLFFLFTVISSIVSAQNGSNSGSHRSIHITPPDRKIDAVIRLSSKRTNNSKKIYYWFDNTELHHTEGGSGGYLLDGDYIEYYYPSNNLFVKGNFKNGLKNGIWYSWYETGTLKEKSAWKKGYLNGKKYLYNDKGILIRTEHYRNNNLNGHRNEKESGSLIKKTYCKNGNPSHYKAWDNIYFLKKKKKSSVSIATSSNPVITSEDKHLSNNRPVENQRVITPIKKENRLRKAWKNAKNIWPF